MVQNSSLKSKSAITILIAMIFVFLAGTSCQNTPSAAIKVQAPPQRSMQRYGRIDIPEEYLAQGFRELCLQLSQSCGPIDVEPIISRYIVQVHQSLFQYGFCRLGKLNINGSTVDIDVYFLPDQKPPALRMEAYANGSDQPQATLASHYTISQQ
jgi:hypothetical protein